MSRAVYSFLPAVAVACAARCLAIVCAVCRTRRAVVMPPYDSDAVRVRPRRPVQGLDGGDAELFLKLIQSSIDRGYGERITGPSGRSYTRMRHLAACQIGTQAYKCIFRYLTRLISRD